jgi:hypothetical protein
MNRTPVNFWSVLLPLPTSRGDSGLDSGEVVPIAQLFADRQEHTDIEAVRRSEGSRASFLYARPSAAPACGLRYSPRALLPKEEADERSADLPGIP